MLFFFLLVLSVSRQGITWSSGPVDVRQEEASPGGGVGGGRFYRHQKLRREVLSTPNKD
jgi:hypothetical protein